MAKETRNIKPHPSSSTSAIGPNPEHIVNTSPSANIPLKFIGASEVITSGKPSETFSGYHNNSWVFEAVIAGKGSLSVNQFSCTPAQGDLYILSQNSPYSMGTNRQDPWQKVFFHARGTLIESLIKQYGLAGHYYFPKVNLSPLIYRVFNLHREDSQNFPHQFPLIVHELIAQLHRHVYHRHQTQHPDIIKDMIRHLHQHIEKPLTLDDMADTFHCSKIHLIRQFKTHLQQSPYDYLLNKRFEQAKWMLTATAQPIQDIARQLQFNDAHYFSSFFKRRANLSPRAYRQRSRIV